MSVSRVCDICGGKVEEEEYHGELNFYNYDDRYNSNLRHGTMDICGICMMSTFSKATIDKNVDI